MTDDVAIEAEYLARMRARTPEERKAQHEAVQHACCDAGFDVVLHDLSETPTSAFGPGYRRLATGELVRGPEADIALAAEQREYELRHPRKPQR